MDIKPIKNSKDYQNALRMIDSLWDAKKNSPEYDKLDILTTLVESYESKHFPIDSPDPIEALKSVMEDQNLKSVDLGNLIGGRSRANEILNKKRKFTMILVKNKFRKFLDKLIIILLIILLVIKIVSCR